MIEEREQKRMEQLTDSNLKKRKKTNNLKNVIALQNRTLLYSMIE